MVRISLKVLLTWIFFFLFSSFSFAVQYPSSYCDYIKINPVIPVPADWINNVWLGDSVRNGWGFTSHSTSFAAVLKDSAPADLKAEGAVAYYNPGFGNEWIPTSKPTHSSYYRGEFRYDQTGDYRVRFFFGNTKTKNYLICSNIARIYEIEGKPGKYELVANSSNSQVTFSPTVGIMGGLYFKASNPLGQLWKEVRLTAVSTPPIYSYFTGLSPFGARVWVNLSGGVNSSTVRIEGPDKTRAVLKDVTVYYRTSTAYIDPKPSLPPDFNVEKCYQKNGIRYCCKWVNGRKICWIIMIPPPKYYTPKSQKRKIRLYQYLSKFKKLQEKKRETSFVKLDRTLNKFRKLLK